MKSVNLKQFGLALAITVVLFGTLELVSALIAPAKTDTKTSTPDTVTAAPGKAKNKPSIDSESIIARLNQLAPEKVEPDPTEAALANAAQQAKAAEAKIDKTLKPKYAAFDEDHQIGLVGVIGTQNYTAVLSLINYASGQTSYHQLSEGEKLGDYQLVQLESNSARLAGRNQEITLQLFRTEHSS